jgi:Ca2+-binding RTX toxin-like protein
MMKRGRSRIAMSGSALATTAALGVLLLGLPSAEAQQGEGVRISSGTSPGGLPVIAISGTAGDDGIAIRRVGDEIQIATYEVLIADPLPEGCRRAFANVVYCDARRFDAIHVFTGGGNDDVDFDVETLFEFETLVLLEEGADRARETRVAPPAMNRVAAAARDRPDIFVGGPGNDTIRAKRGRDVIRGNDGNDTLSGGTGADRIFGDAGRDRCSGGAGRDRIRGCE